MTSSGAHSPSPSGHPQVAGSPVVPVRRGASGPTPSATRYANWRRVSYGMYVPRGTPETVRQHIANAAARLADAMVRQRTRGTGVSTQPAAVSGWAALVLRGAHYLVPPQIGRQPARQAATLTSGGSRPVLVIAPSAHLRSSDTCLVKRSRLTPAEVEWVDGIPVTTAVRAIFDEIQCLVSFEQAVITIDMAIQAKLCTLADFIDYLAAQKHRPGLSLARQAVSHASNCSKSPPETIVRLTLADAGYRDLLVNQPVFDPGGGLMGFPDLLDVSAGVVVEYDGGYHLDSRQRARDNAREQQFRRFGLEYVAFVAPDLANRAGIVERFEAVRARALNQRGRPQEWSLDG